MSYQLDITIKISYQEVISFIKYHLELIKWSILEESYRIFEEEQTRSFRSHSISDLNNIILTKINNNEIHLSTVSTQTDNYSSIQIEYQYENLRRVNSNLLDYMFIPT
ncbi:unnamed protein product, partial [Adineta steineri]